MDELQQALAYNLYQPGVVQALAEYMRQNGRDPADLIAAVNALANRPATEQNQPPELSNDIISWLRQRGATGVIGDRDLGGLNREWQLLGAGGQPLLTHGYQADRDNALEKFAFNGGIPLTIATLGALQGGGLLSGAGSGSAAGAAGASAADLATLGVGLPTEIGAAGAGSSALAGAGGMSLGSLASGVGGALRDNAPLLARLGLGAAALGGLAAASGGGKIDTSGLEGLFAQSQQIAGRQQDLAERAYTDLNERFGKYAPLFEQLIGQSLGQAQRAGERADSEWQRYTGAVRPVQDKMFSTALNYDTPERRAAEAARAVADVDQQLSIEEGNRNRALRLTGATPDSMQQRALAGDLALGAAKARASAANAARRQVEQTGIGLVDNAARYGLALPSQSMQLSGLSGTLANSAGTQLAQQEAVRNQGLGAVSNLFGNAVQANNAAGNLYSNIANIQAQNQAQRNQGLAGLGGLLGTLGTAPRESLIGSILLGG